MTPETRQLVRGLIEAWNRRDDALALEYLTPEIEWLPAGPAAVERAVYRGYEQVARGFESVWETWEVFRFEEAELREAEGSAVWLGRVKMKGVASHVELDQEFALHVRLAGEKICRIEAFRSWEEALAAGEQDL